MIRTTNKNVPYYWYHSRSAKSGNGQYSTDGDKLRSYNKVIGITEGGQKILLEYTAKGEYISQTTSQHVGKARQYCDQSMHPEAAKHGGLIS
tara:strand:+ start:403 stop:678 length:276 start_codon:yes stop_codon:yes gene_type:complete